MLLRGACVERDVGCRQSRHLDSRPLAAAREPVKLRVGLMQHLAIAFSQSLRAVLVHL